MGRVAQRGFSRICPRSSSFSLYLNDLFYLTESAEVCSTEVCNFADDIAFFACDKDLNSLIKNLEYDSLLAIKWSQNNNTKSNQDKMPPVGIWLQA